MLLLTIAVLSVFEQMFPIVVLWILARALNTSIGLSMLIVAVPLTVFVSRIPVTVWGLGVVEGANVYLLGLFGVPASEALALSLAARIVDMVSSLPGVLFWKDLRFLPTRRESGGDE